MTDLNPTLDTDIYSVNPDTNYGSLTYVSPSYASKAGTINRVILLFDLSLYSGITEAILKLNCISGSVNAAEWYIKRLTATDLVEDEITWNNKSSGNAWSSAGGDFTSDDQVTIDIPQTTGVKEYDVTAMAQAAEGGTFGLIIHEKDSGISGCSFDSKEGTTPPVLSVTVPITEVHRHGLPGNLPLGLLLPRSVRCG